MLFQVGQDETKLFAIISNWTNKAFSTAKCCDLKNRDEIDIDANETLPYSKDVQSLNIGRANEEPFQKHQQPRVPKIIPSRSFVSWNILELLTLIIFVTKGHGR